MSNPYQSPQYEGKPLSALGSDNNQTYNPVPPMQRRLARSVTDKYVAGVLGGIAETYHINSTLVRLLFLVSMFLPGPQILMYLVMWFVMPRREF